MKKAASVLLILVVVGACGPKTHTVIKPIESSSPANRYIAEFRSYDFNQKTSYVAPDGSAQVELSTTGTIPMTIFQTCHSLIVASRDGTKRHLLTAREADPGSGGSFFWAWSKDSKAIFVRGSHSGLDCAGSDRGEFRIIYTLADSTAWEVSVQDLRGPR